jgi:hypothetical protein
MRRRFQFSLKALFRLIAVVSVLLVVCAWAARISTVDVAVLLFVLSLLLWVPPCFES